MRVPVVATRLRLHAERPSVPRHVPPGQAYYIVVEDAYEETGTCTRCTGTFTIRVNVVPNAGSGSGR